MSGPDYRSILVVNTRTREGRMFLGLSPRQAVMAAYADRLGGRDAQGLEDGFGHLVKGAGMAVSCGDWRVDS